MAVSATNTGPIPEPANAATMGAAVRAASGPAAEIEASERLLCMASAHPIQARAPELIPATVRIATRPGKTGISALAALATARVTNAIRNMRASGLHRRGSTRLATANPPTWATEINPAVPSVTPKRTATTGMRNGVAENTPVTAAVAARTAGLAPGRAEVSVRTGPNTGA